MICPSSGRCHLRSKRPPCASWAKPTSPTTSKTPPPARPKPIAVGREGFFGGLFQPNPWQHTAHAFGYFAPGAAAHTLPIQDAGSLAPDSSLKGQRIKVTLDRLRIADYPGSGEHHLLLDFYAQNQVAGSSENLHFNATYTVRAGEQAAIRGYPIFLGLNVGANGVMFRCYIVAVSNSQDTAFLSFLNSDVFKAGLTLVKTAQPAVAPLSEIAYGLTRSIAQRNQNVAVQNIELGLDFTQIATGARLAEGSYIAVQIPGTLQAVWDWRDYVFSLNSGQVVKRDDPTTMIPYNYLVFSVSRYEDEAP